MMIYHQKGFTGWQLTLPPWRGIMAGGGGGRAVHPGRGDTGDHITDSQHSRERAHQTWVSRCFHEAQEIRDKRHKAQTKAFWAKKRQAQKELRKHG